MSKCVPLSHAMYLLKLPSKPEDFRFVFSLIGITRDFASEIEPYPFSGDFTETAVSREHIICSPFYYDKMKHSKSHG